VSGRLLAVAFVMMGVVASSNVASADPTKQECVDANEAGQTLRQSGDLRAAHDEFAACLASSCPVPVRLDCADRLAEVDRTGRAVATAVGAARAQRVTGLVLAVVGTAGVVVGGVLGIVAKTTYDSALRDNCAGDADRCNGAGVSQVSTAHTQAAASTIAMVAGGVVAVGGVALWATARSDVRVVPVVGGATLALGGTF
jgi:hypothetical protein